MGRAERSYVAAIVSGANLRSVPCTPVDAYLFSLVDGIASTSELALTTNLSLEEVHERLGALVGHGVVRWVSASPPGSNASRTASALRGAEPSERSHAGGGYVLGREAFEQVEATRTCARGAFAEEVSSARSVRATPGAAPDKGQVVSRGQPAERRQSLGAAEQRSQNERVADPPARPKVGASALAPAPPVVPQNRPSAPVLDEMETLLGRALSEAREGHEKRERAARAAAQRADTPFLLPEAHRQQIDDLHARMEQLHFYERLELSVGASRRQIRAAYGRLAKVYHPDRLFRKDIGAYKPKMERIFALLTEAYETLSRPAQRDAYDAKLRAAGIAVPARTAAVAATSDRPAERLTKQPGNQASSGVVVRASVASSNERAPRAPEPPPFEEERITMDLDESRALAAEAAGQWALAATAWRRIAQRRPEDVRLPCRYVHAILQVEDANLDDAQSAIQEAFVKARNDPEVRLALAALYVRRARVLNAELELGAAERLRARPREVARLRSLLAALKERSAPGKKPA